MTDWPLLTEYHGQAPLAYQTYMYVCRKMLAHVEPELARPKAANNANEQVAPANAHTALK